MKLKGRYRLRKVGDSYVVVKIGGGQVDFSRLITLNETGAFIFGKLEKGITMDELVKAITEEYDIDADGAKAAAENYIAKLVELGIAEAD